MHSVVFGESVKVVVGAAEGVQRFVCARLHDHDVDIHGQFVDIGAAFLLVSRVQDKGIAQDAGHEKEDGEDGGCEPWLGEEGEGIVGGAVVGLSFRP